MKLFSSLEPFIAFYIWLRRIQINSDVFYTIQPAERDQSLILQNKIAMRCFTTYKVTKEASPHI